MSLDVRPVHYPVPPSDINWRKEILRALITAVLTLAGAVPAAIWGARGVLADFDKRITANESKLLEQRQIIDQLKVDFVPRNEHQVHWQTQEQTARDIREDIRELRKAIEQRPH